MKLSLLAALLFSVVGAGQAGKMKPGRANLHLLSLTFGDLQRGAEIPSHNSEGRLDRVLSRIYFTQRDVHLWVEARPSGAQRECFRIDGICNPSVEVIAGARLTITLVNLDPVVSANLTIDSHGPPFDTVLAPRGWQQARFTRSGIRVENVASPDGDTIHDAVLVFEARSPGVAWYRSLSPQAANAGLYGEIDVVP
jgi:hypothetical protein